MFNPPPRKWNHCGRFWNHPSWMDACLWVCACRSSPPSTFSAGLPRVYTRLISADWGAESNQGRKWLRRPWAANSLFNSEALWKHGRPWTRRCHYVKSYVPSAAAASSLSACEFGTDYTKQNSFEMHISHEFWRTSGITLSVLHPFVGTKLSVH